MCVLVGGRWLNKLLRPPGLVDTIGRWNNGPTHAEQQCVLTSIGWFTSAKIGYYQAIDPHDEKT
jgi:hypothetical protein